MPVQWYWAPPSAGETFALVPEMVHLWCASLDQPALRVEELAHLLSPDERLRAQRFYFERDRTHFIVGRGLLRTILSQYVSLQPNRLQFCYGSRGKPELTGTAGEMTLQFNLTHSFGLALYAIAYGHKIGVDIERLRPMPDADQIAEHFFCSRERAVLRALAGGKKDEAFFNCWTRKEAYLKAVGDGLSQPLDSIEVSLLPGEPANFLSTAQDAQGGSWWLEALSPAAGYVAALVVKGMECRLACWQWLG